MAPNMGAIDCGLRALVVAPAAMLVTAVTAFCPTYTAVGVSTDPRLHRVGHRLRGGHA
jgi:hypothetical protein